MRKRTGFRCRKVYMRWKETIQRFVMLVKWPNLSFSRLPKLRCRLIIAVAEVCCGQLILFFIPIYSVDPFQARSITLVPSFLHGLLGCVNPLGMVPYFRRRRCCQRWCWSFCRTMVNWRYPISRVPLHYPFSLVMLFWSGGCWNDRVINKLS